MSPRTAAATVDELAAELLADLSPGTARGSVSSGLIGEIGVSSRRIAAVELRVLQAVARAQRATGAPVSLHSVAPGHMGLEALCILKEHGVDPGRVAVCHLDSGLDADADGGSDADGHLDVARGLGIDLDYCREIVREGAFVEFDGFGWPAPAEGQVADADPSRADRERVTAVAALCSEGLAGRVMVSHDIAMKIRLVAYGGCGYAHLARAMPARFAEQGVDAATLRRIMVDNPARWLAWGAPRA